MAQTIVDSGWSNPAVTHSQKPHPTWHPCHASLGPCNISSQVFFLHGNI